MIKNLTCIVSPQENKKPGDLDPGEGLKLREGIWPTYENAIVTTAYRGDVTPNSTENWCLDLDGSDVQDGAANGHVQIKGSVFACSDLTAGRTVGGMSDVDWLRTTEGNAVYHSAEAGEDPTAASNPGLVILDGYFATPVADMKAGTETIPSPVDGSDFIGGLKKTDDWTTGWTYGLDPANRGEPLWFQ